MGNRHPSSSTTTKSSSPMGVIASDSQDVFGPPCCHCATKIAVSPLLPDKQNYKTETLLRRDDREVPVPSTSSDARQEAQQQQQQQQQRESQQEVQQVSHQEGSYHHQNTKKLMHNIPSLTDISSSSGERDQNRRSATRRLDTNHEEEEVACGGGQPDEVSQSTRSTGSANSHILFTALSGSYDRDARVDLSETRGRDERDDDQDRTQRE